MFFEHKTKSYIYNNDNWYHADTFFDNFKTELIDKKSDLYKTLCKCFIKRTIKDLKLEFPSDLYDVSLRFENEEDFRTAKYLLKKLLYKNIHTTKKDRTKAVLQLIKCHRRLKESAKAIKLYEKVKRNEKDLFEKTLIRNPVFLILVGYAYCDLRMYNEANNLAKRASVIIKKTNGDYNKYLNRLIEIIKQNR